MRAIFLLLILAGCSTAPKPSVQIQTVQVPVTAPCVPRAVKDGRPAHYPDEGIERDPDPAARYLHIAQANEMRKARLAIVEPIISTCP